MTVAELKGGGGSRYQAFPKRRETDEGSPTVGCPAGFQEAASGKEAKRGAGGAGEPSQLRNSSFRENVPLKH